MSVASSIISSFRQSRAYRNMRSWFFGATSMSLR